VQPGVLEMRMLFLLLLLLNLLFYGWQNWRPHQDIVVVNPLPETLNSIELMRERMGEKANPSAEFENRNEATPDNKSCHTIGPFEDNQMVEELKQELQQFTNHLTVRVMQESQLHRYWVYIKAANNEDAVATSKLLVLQNVSDYYVMSSGNEKRVSLGHFKEKSYAERRAQQLKELGFAVETEVVYHYFKLYWLDYELLVSQKDGVKDLIAPYLQNDISILSRECEKIVY
jgi:hypothetical protein